MRKEILFAIVAGVTFGLIIAFGVWRANVALKPEEVSTVTEEESSTPTPETGFGVTIAKPQDYQVITSSPTVLSGVTKSGAWVSVSGEDKDYVIETDESGAFEIEIELVGGVNEIIITAFDEEGNSVKESLLLAYSTEFPSPEEAKNVPFTYIGTVTDISEQTLQINRFVFKKTEEDAGEIQQISVNEDETDFVKITKTSKVVKFSDVAIGDFIIAMGYKNGNGVLDGKRILITSSLKLSGRKAISGKPTDVGGKSLKLTSNNKEWAVEFGKTWVGPELYDIEDDDVVIIAGTAEDNTLEARTLYIIPQETPSPAPTPSPSPEPEEE